MIETLREITLDFQEVELETGVPRHLKISTVPGEAAVASGYAVVESQHTCFRSLKNCWTAEYLVKIYCT